jgi:hypothetical protein
VNARLIADTDYDEPHYRMQSALNRQQIDLAVHWFQNVIYGNAQPPQRTPPRHAAGIRAVAGQAHGHC